MSKKQKKYEFPASNRNIVIYARYSSSNQTEQSIEGQLTVCYDYCKRNNYVVVNEYIDRAISGRSDERPAFLQMINDAKKHEFAYVLVYKLDRFSRNMYNSAVYKHELSKEGVTLLSAMENIGQGPESILLEAVIEASAEYYSIDLAQKVKRGMIETAKKGKVVGGYAPIGYKIVDRYYQIDEETAPTVRWLFKEYANGTPKKKLLDELNRRGMRNNRGNPLTQSTLQKVFTNTKYIGYYYYEGIKIDVPAIIDEELFNKCQERAKMNKQTGARNKAIVPYILSGKMKCGHCGAPMVGISGTSKTGNSFYYYACSNRNKHKKNCECQKKNERKEFIEDFVVELTKQFVLDPAQCKKIAAAIVNEYNKEFGQENDDIKACKKHIEKLEIEINNLLSLYSEEGLNANGKTRVKDMMNAKEDELSASRLDLSKLEIGRNVELKVEDIEKWLMSFVSGDLNDIEFRRKMVDTFINSIFIFNDKIVIYYNVKDTKQVEYMTMADELSSAIEESVRFSVEELTVSVQNTNSLFVLNGRLCLVAYF